MVPEPDSLRFDPLAYIESAFVDGRPAEKVAEKAWETRVDVPEFGEYLAGRTPRPARPRGRRTAMRAPRPRRSAAPTGELDADLKDALQRLPASLAFLLGEFDDRTTEHSYKDGFVETRGELVRRLLDPELTLEETSRLLGVCPATVRRYTNRSWLAHHRTAGGQRRFRLSSIITFVDQHGRWPEATTTRGSEA